MKDSSAPWAIRDATASDAAAAVACAVTAFEHDPQMAYFFQGPPAARRSLMPEFFDILFGARLALSMPVKVLERGGEVLGLVMGSSVAPPAWPEHFKTRWAELASRQDGLAQRFQAADDAIAVHVPAAPHYYLGVVGVHPVLQGQGAGAALIAAFCSASDGNPLSTGVLLETASDANVTYYQRRGFELLGQAQLDGSSRLRVLFKPSAITARP